MPSVIEYDAAASMTETCAPARIPSLVAEGAIRATNGHIDFPDGPNRPGAKHCRDMAVEIGVDPVVDTDDSAAGPIACLCHPPVLLLREDEGLFADDVRNGAGAGC